MFQDIEPHHLNISFSLKNISSADYMVVWHHNSVLLQSTADGCELPTYEVFTQNYEPKQAPIYLFSIDHANVFLYTEPVDVRPPFEYIPQDALKNLSPSWLGFVCACAAHLAKWYSTHRFCGKCGAKMEHSKTERALYCPTCNTTAYPTISPVVIVGITDHDRLLLTRYNRGNVYQRHALVAGFVEFGETLEDAVRREVMEEVGLKVKNIRYYKSQPWAFSESLLMGFFADVDGDPTPRLDPSELSEAHWFDRQEIPIEDTAMSLTWEMIEAFHLGKM